MKPKQNTIIYDQDNHTFLRRMRLRRDSLRIHGRTGPHASLSLSRLPALQWRSVFVFRDCAEGSVQAHTYSSYARGIDLMNTTYNFLDLTAKGRDENPEATQDWVRYHDEYKGASKDCCA